MDIILRVIVSASKDSVCEEVLLLSHVILTKVGPKGRICENDYICYIAGDFPATVRPLLWLVHGHMISNNETVYHQIP